LPKETLQKRPPELGKLLLEADFVTKTALEKALAFQEANADVSLYKALVETGVLTGRQIAAALSARLQIPLLTLDRIYPPVHLLSLIPPQTARSQGLIPVLEINGNLVVAVGDPLSASMHEDLEAIVQMPVYLAVAPAEEILTAVTACYPDQQKAGKGWVWPGGGGSAREENRSDIFTIGNRQGSRNPEEGSAVVQPGPVHSYQNPSTGASSPAEAVTLFEKGLEAARKGAYEEALSHFEAALQLDPNDRVCKANIRRIKRILAEKGAD
jgi:tetratricopeptide (TPR) repeat protein